MGSKSLEDQRLGTKLVPRFPKTDVIDGLRRLARGDGLSPGTSGRLIDYLESGAIAVERALAWIHDPDDPDEFERIAAEFFQATGFLRPGKDYPVGGSVDEHARLDAWEKWRHSRSAEVRAQLLAFVERVRG